jgi:TonB family protein
MIDSAFLSNLFAWACQVALISAVAALLLRVLRIEAPSIRYGCWRIVLAVCIALPILQPWKIAPRSLDADETLSVLATGQAGAVSGSPSVPHASTAVPAVPPVSWPALAGVALVAGAVLRLAWLGAGILRLRRLRKAGEPAAPCDEHDEVARLIEAGAEIRYVQVIGQPVTFGVRHPVVLLPETLRSLPAIVQRAVLAHELWHVRRRDWMWILTEEVVRAILWFHPAIWFLVSRVQSAREEVVDELTVFVTNSRRGYIEALLAFADEPPLFAAAPFARRRHLFQRMLLISREAVMSSRRIVVSGATMVLVLLATISAGAMSFPLTRTSAAPAVMKPVSEAPSPAAAQPRVPGELSVARALESPQAPVRDAGPGGPRPQEIELKKAIAAAPTSSVALYYELATLQERRGAKAEAEATLQAGRRAFPGHDGIVKQLTAFYTRNNQFDKAIAMLEDRAATDPSNPAGHHLVATYYEEKVRRDAQLSPTEKATYIQAGIAAEDRALTYNPDFVDAMVYKNILLRHQAANESDAARRAQLISEADTLRNRAMELNKARATSRGVGAGIAPPPPPPPPLGGDPPAPGAPVRVGGNIKPPAKVRDVRPLYPPDAMRARVQGVVILETMIDPSGRVMDAKVLRSIPMLDEAAVDAVLQWEFTPTLLNGAAVPVIMTVTVNFTLQ